MSGAKVESSDIIQALWVYEIRQVLQTGWRNVAKDAYCNAVCNVEIQNGWLLQALGCI